MRSQPDAAARPDVATDETLSGRRARAAVWWMLGFGALHAVGALAAAAGVGPFTGVGAVVVNAVYTAVPLVGAGVADAIARPGRAHLPAWFVRVGAVVGSLALGFVGTLAVVHQLGALFDRVDQNLAEHAFELYVILGAGLFIPPALRHLRRGRTA